MMDDPEMMKAAGEYVAQAPKRTPKWAAVGDAFEAGAKWGKARASAEDGQLTDEEADEMVCALFDHVLPGKPLKGREGMRAAYAALSRIRKEG
jgi:hypothetical protein